MNALGETIRKVFKNTFKNWQWPVLKRREGRVGKERKSPPLPHRWARALLKDPSLICSDPGFADILRFANS